MTELERDVLLKEYCSDNMRGLRRICDPVIRRKGLPQMDYDDLYSAALDTLYNSLSRYEESNDCTFKTFLVGNIKRTFYDWTRDRQRFKRCNTKTDSDGKTIVIPDISIDAPTEDGIDICEKIDSGFRIEDELSEEIGFSFGDKVEKFLEELPLKVQRIARLLSRGYEKKDIINLLNIEEKQYLDALKTMKQTEYISILY